MTDPHHAAALPRRAAAVCCLTTLRFAQLPQARVLASTLKRLHPGWHLVAALADAPPTALHFDPARELFDKVIPARDMHAALAAPQWAPPRTAEQTCAAVQGLALQQLAQAGHGKILVLDPGVAVLNPLTPLADLLDTHSIVLIPHRLAADAQACASPALVDAAQAASIFTPGCVAFRAGAEGSRFAAAWGERLLHEHEQRTPGGPRTAQRWLDRVPVLFDGVHLLKDPGWQVSSHNLNERELAFDASGRLLANGHVVHTFDVSDLADRPGRVHDGARLSLAAHDLLCWYRQAVAQFDDPAIPTERRRGTPDHAAPAAPAQSQQLPAPPQGRLAPAPVAQGLTPTRHGLLRCFLDGDLISRFLRLYGEWAHFENLLLASLRCARIFDIGAYLGTFSLGMAISEPDFIVAVDANPEAYELLRANLARNLPVPYATVNAAVLQQSGPVTGAPLLADNHGSFTVRGGQHAALGTAIAARTLADLRVEFGAYDLLKLDVEGSEGEVIRSDAAWIAEHKPAIWAECNEHPDSLALFALLQELGYDLYYYRFPAFNPDNFHGSAQRLVPVAFEAGLLAVTPVVQPQCPQEAARAGAALVHVETVEALRQALWLTPRHGDASWEGLSRTELLALLARQGEASNYDGFLSAGHAATPPAAAPATAPAPGRDVGASYRREVSAILEAHDEQEGMSLAVGGQFEAIGQMEYLLLLQHGLKEQATLVDVGCGSGRLAAQLKDRFAGRYVGIDVVPALLAYAERICGRPDWTFAQAPGFSIPEPDDSADIICFFSVFTHLLHEESFTYLKDARRVCKPGGKIIFSFLEFRIPSQWAMFELALADTRPEKVLNQFMDRDAIRAWADRLGLDIVEICDGDEPHIDLRPLDGSANTQAVTGKGSLGQSVCVLAKPPR